MRSAFQSTRPPETVARGALEAAREMGPGLVRELRAALLDSLIAVDERESGGRKSEG